jgi:hypothetical protein
MNKDQKQERRDRVDARIVRTTKDEALRAKKLADLRKIRYQDDRKV